MAKKQRKNNKKQTIRWPEEQRTGRKTNHKKAKSTKNIIEDNKMAEKQKTEQKTDNTTAKNRQQNITEDRQYYGQKQTTQHNRTQTAMSKTLHGKFEKHESQQNERRKNRPLKGKQPMLHCFITNEISPALTTKETFKESGCARISSCFP